MIQVQCIKANLYIIATNNWELKLNKIICKNINKDILIDKFSKIFVRPNHLILQMTAGRNLK